MPPALRSRVVVGLDLGASAGRAAGAARAWRGRMLEDRPDPAATEVYARLLAERVRRRYPALRAIA
jgi:hypothetical protein